MPLLPMRLLGAVSLGTKMRKKPGSTCKCGCGHGKGGWTTLGSNMKHGVKITAQLAPEDPKMSQSFLPRRGRGPVGSRTPTLSSRSILSAKRE